MSIDYDRLRELSNEHTPGPWVRHPDQPHALCNLGTKFLVHHEMVTNRGMVTSAEDMANTELIALAPDMARELLALRDGIEVIRDYCAGVTTARRSSGDPATEVIARELGAVDRTLADLLNGDTE